MKKISDKHLLLLLLYCPGIKGYINEELIGRTRVVKSVFLFFKEIIKNFTKDKNIDFIDIPEFYAWNYGPFSRDIYTDLEFLINNGLVNTTNTDDEISEAEQDEIENWVDDYKVDLLEEDQEYSMDVKYVEELNLTDKGLTFVKDKIWPSLTENQKTILTKFKESITKGSIAALMNYVYLKYPEYTGKSLIKKQVLG